MLSILVCKSIMNYKIQNFFAVCLHGNIVKRTIFELFRFWDSFVKVWRTPRPQSNFTLQFHIVFTYIWPSLAVKTACEKIDTFSQHDNTFIAISSQRVRISPKIIIKNSRRDKSKIRFICRNSLSWNTPASTLNRKRT